MDIRIPKKQTPKSVEIFFCYARVDQALLLALKMHLAPLQRKGFVTLWADIDINAGTEWDKEIHRHLHTAHIILLLISPDFIASDYCYGIEMQQALKRHDDGEACVIPIILRPVAWQTTSLSKLQALPKGAKAITTWDNQDTAFYDAAEGIRNAVETHLKEEQRRQAEAEQACKEEEARKLLVEEKEHRRLAEEERNRLAEAIEQERRFEAEQAYPVKMDKNQPLNGQGEVYEENLLPENNPPNIPERVDSHQHSLQIFVQNEQMSTQDHSDILSPLQPPFQNEEQTPHTGDISVQIRAKKKKHDYTKGHISRGEPQYGGIYAAAIALIVLWLLPGLNISSIQQASDNLDAHAQGIVQTAYGSDGKVGGGAEIDFRPLSGHTVTLSVPDDLNQGETVPIIYDPHNPNHAVIENSVSDRIVDWLTNSPIVRIILDVIMTLLIVLVGVSFRFSGVFVP